MDNTYDFLTARPKEFKQLASKDMLFLHYKCPQQDQYIHIYNHWNQIAFTLDGDRVFHQGAKSWLMTQNTTIFAKKTAWKQEFRGYGWELLAFYFKDDFLCNFFEKNRAIWPLRNLPPPPKDMFITLKINDSTRSFFLSLLPYFLQQPPPPESLLELKFKELLFNVLSNPENAPFLSYINSISGKHKTSLADVMEANYHFNLSIEEFARLADRSVATFKRDFFNSYCCTPGKWLTARRTEYAKLLIDTTDKNIKEIVYDSGFESATHFSRVFKSKFGVSPSQYRANISVRSGV